VVVVAAAVLVVDQLTKQWALSALADGPIELFGAVRLLLTFNSAGAFGLGGAAVPFLAVAALGLVVFMASSGTMTRSPLLATAVGLVLGGAFGNVADRLFRGRGWLQGAVVDFIDVGPWPVFNVADTAITCGCVLLVWAGWRVKD
jgi:signal peptidase II